MIRMFCLTKEGNSVLLHISGFLSYFYADLPPGVVPNEGSIQQLQQRLNELGKNRQNGSECVSHIEVVERESIKEYKG